MKCYIKKEFVRNEWDCCQPYLSATQETNMSLNFDGTSRNVVPGEAEVVWNMF